MTRLIHVNEYVKWEKYLQTLVCKLLHEWHKKRKRKFVFLFCEMAIWSLNILILILLLTGKVKSLFCTLATESWLSPIMSLLFIQLCAWNLWTFFFLSFYHYAFLPSFFFFLQKSKIPNSDVHCCGVLFCFILDWDSNYLLPLWLRCIYYLCPKFTPNCRIIKPLRCLFFL